MDLTAWMEQWNMFPNAGGTILCAVSGGRDSVCLLHYLHSISGRYGFFVAVGHYNHHMRPTAQRDEDFVRALCAQLEVPFYTDGCDVVAAAWRRWAGVCATNFWSGWQTGWAQRASPPPITWAIRRRRCF